jgi:hypothetical protein
VRRCGISEGARLLQISESSNGLNLRHVKSTGAYASDSVAVHEGLCSLECWRHVAHVDLQFRIPGVVEGAVAGGRLKKSRANVSSLDGVRVLESK